MQMYDEDVVCFFVNKVKPSLMTQESILGHLCAPNGAQKLCAPCAPNGAQMGHKIGHKFGAQILGTELILKSIKIIYSTSFLVNVPHVSQMGYTFGVQYRVQG